MGLDHGISSKQYIGAQWEHRKVVGEINLTEYEDKKPIEIDLKRISQIEYAEITWRKANHFHIWFVENVQNGEDECRDHYLDEEKIKELQDLCKTILVDHSKAEELLPTKSGFFFGGTDYDEWYFKSLKRAVAEIDQMLERRKNLCVDYYYWSSW